MGAAAQRTEVFSVTCGIMWPGLEIVMEEKFEKHQEKPKTSEKFAGMSRAQKIAEALKRFENLNLSAKRYEKGNDEGGFQDVKKGRDAIKNNKNLEDAYNRARELIEE